MILVNIQRPSAVKKLNEIGKVGLRHLIAAYFGMDRRFKARKQRKPGDSGVPFTLADRELEALVRAKCKSEAISLRQFIEERLEECDNGK